MRLDYKPVVMTQASSRRSASTDAQLSEASKHVRALQPRDSTPKPPLARTTRSTSEPTGPRARRPEQVKWHQDGTLTFRRSCAHGVCGSDAMRHQRRNRLACKVLIQDVGDKITLEPIRGLPVIKDLVVDMEPFFDAVQLGHAVPDHHRRARLHASASRPPRTASASTTPPSASSAPPARPPARSSGPTRTSSARPRSSTPTASSSTAATRAPPSASTSSTSAAGVWRCRTASTAPTPAPAASRSPRPSRRSSGRSSTPGSDRRAAQVAKLTGKVATQTRAPRKIT